MDLREAVEQLREPETRRTAWQALWTAGDAAIPAVSDGLGHEARSVRTVRQDTAAEDLRRSA